MSRPALIVIVLAVLVMVGFTIAEARFSDRWSGSQVTAEEFSELLTRVPYEIGDWHGTDEEVTEEAREGSGSKGRLVSRVYHNSKTGEIVRVWMIVGHSRDICRHTPDVCYPSSGFKAVGEENLAYTVELDNGEKADFWSNAFIREDSTAGRQLVRVFWSWYKPNSEGTIAWEAPQRQRFYFGNTPALYKMYFSSEQTDVNETVDRSVCVRFAKEFIPVVNRAFTSQEPLEPAGDEETASDEPTAGAA